MNKNFSDLYYINYTKKQHKSKYIIRKIAILHNTEIHFLIHHLSLIFLDCLYEKECQKALNPPTL